MSPFKEAIAKEEIREIESIRDTLWLDFSKLLWRTSHNWDHWVASREPRTSVLQPQETESCQQPQNLAEDTSLRWVHW